MLIHLYLQYTADLLPADHCEQLFYSDVLPVTNLLACSLYELVCCVSLRYHSCCKMDRFTGIV